MNNLVDKVQQLMATDARATVEPGGMMRFEDENIRILADIVGSRKVRIWNVQTEERIFLGTAESPAIEGQENWANYISEIISSGPKALIKPDDGNTGQGGFSTPEPQQLSSSSSSTEAVVRPEQVKQEQPVVDAVAGIFAPITEKTGGTSGNVASSSSADKTGSTILDQFGKR